MYADLMDTIGFVTKYDPAVGEAMNKELARQRRNLELIASENIVSPAVMAAMGSVLTNKYAEGYSGKRYYGGCECVDLVEDIAIDRAKKLFGANFANVQPHSGAQANMAAYFAMIQHEPCRRRSPDPRLAGQYVGQIFPLCPLRRKCRRLY